jgi:hypothetical protein
MASLILLYREECELCGEMQAELASLRRVVDIPEVRLVDVDSDPELTRRHGLHVPVLLLDETVVCRHRLDRAELLRLLRPRTPPAAHA